MEECKLCGKNGEDISLFSANHKELGSIMVCDECWRKLYEKMFILYCNGFCVH